MISGPKYNFSVGQKYFFVVSSKVSIFHQILPMYNLVDFNFPILKSDGICNLQPEVEHIGFRLERG